MPRAASEEAVALLSLGGIDDRVEPWAALVMLRNNSLNQRRGPGSTRSGEALTFFPARLPPVWPGRFATAAPVIRIEQSSEGVKAVFLAAGSHHTLAADYLICAVPFSVQKGIEVAPPFSPGKRRAIEQLPYLSGSKIFLQSRTRFWARRRPERLRHHRPPHQPGMGCDLPAARHARHSPGLPHQRSLPPGDRRWPNASGWNSPWSR